MQIELLLKQEKHKAMFEVLEGIENGVEIIKEGARSVKDGQTVKVLTYETGKNG